MELLRGVNSKTCHYCIRLAGLFTDEEYNDLYALCIRAQHLTSAQKYTKRNVHIYPSTCLKTACYQIDMGVWND